jgi:hypothetical protein
MTIYGYGENYFRPFYQNYGSMEVSMGESQIWGVCILLRCSTGLWVHFVIANLTLPHVV